MKYSDLPIDRGKIDLECIGGPLDGQRKVMPAPPIDCWPMSRWPHFCVQLLEDLMPPGEPRPTSYRTARYELRHWRGQRWCWWFRDAPPEPGIAGSGSTV